MTKSEAFRKNAILLWAVLTVAIITFILMPSYMTMPVADNGTSNSPDQTEITLKIMMGFSGLLAASSLMIWHYGLSAQRFRAVAKTAEDPTQLEPKLSRYWLMVCLIAWALNESIASFGLVIATLKGDGNAIIPYGVAALLLNIYMFPRYSAFVPAAPESVTARM